MSRTLGLLSVLAFQTLFGQTGGAGQGTILPTPDRVLYFILLDSQTRAARSCTTAPGGRFCRCNRGRGKRGQTELSLSRRLAYLQGGGRAPGLSL
jgi:hypothetical protein